MIEIKGMLHFTISVSDLDRSEKFYRDVLGMDLIQKVPPLGMAFLKAGGATTSAVVRVTVGKFAWLSGAEEMEETIKRMMKDGHSDAAIAALLNWNEPSSVVCSPA